MIILLVGMAEHRRINGDKVVYTLTSTATNSSRADGYPDFGNLVRAGSLLFIGDFLNFGNDELLFYHFSDENLWLCTLDPVQAEWDSCVARTYELITFSLPTSADLLAHVNAREKAWIQLALA
jgi:hypothetical protein